MKKYCIPTLLAAALLFAGCAKNPRTFTNEEITDAWHKGVTLPVDASLQFPPKPVKPQNDNGLNVLVDVSHQCTFACTAQTDDAEYFAFFDICTDAVENFQFAGLCLEAFFDILQTDHCFFFHLQTPFLQ